MKTKEIVAVTRRIVTGCTAALLLTFIAFRFHFNLSSATSVHLFLVTSIALYWGLLEASVVSLVSVACLDYFFTQPLFVFYMSDSHDWVSLLTFEAAALLVSSLSNKVKRHANASELHQAQLQRLYDLSQNVLLLDRKTDVEQQLANFIRSSFEAKGVALWNAYNSCLSRSELCALSDEEIRSIYTMQTDRDDLPIGVSRRVLRLGTRPIGALVICGHALDAASINAAASLAAITIERAHSFSTETNAEAARQTEQLRSAILDGLAHAFKSPLTTIQTSSSGLLAMDTLSGTEKRLVSLIDRHAAHLGDLTTHLLVTAKLDSSDLKLKREKIDLTQLIQGSTEMIAENFGGHTLKFSIAAQECFVWADGKLFPMALLQLLDNAMKYGRPGSDIVVELQEEPAEMVIAVRNEGSFIPQMEREKVFQRFYRSPGSDHRASGTGVGLSVVRRIAEAHQGRTWVTSDEQTGTTFYLTLPRMAKER